MASWPGDLLEAAARRRSRSGGPSGPTGRWPISPPNPRVPRNSAPSSTTPAPTPISPETWRKLSSGAPSGRRAAGPQLAERGEVGLVVERPAAGTRRPSRCRLGPQHVDHVDVAPAEVGGQAQRAAPARRRGRGRRPPPRRGVRPWAAGVARAARPAPGRPGRARVRAACRRRSPATTVALADAAGQVDDVQVASVVDVELEPDRRPARAAKVEPGRRGGPPGTGRRGRQPLAHQVGRRRGRRRGWTRSPWSARWRRRSAARETGRRRRRPRRAPARGCGRAGAGWRAGRSGRRSRRAYSSKW